MSNVRKYESYKILITYSNGDTEEINYNGINTSNYTEMIKVYQAAKDQYSNESVTIDFLGINSDGQLNIFWTKKFESNSDTDKEKSDQLKDKTSIELIDYIVESINLLKERQDVAPIKLGAANKERDYQLHRLEGLKRVKFNSEQEKNLEKLDIVNKLEEAGDKRREAKVELELLKDLFGGTQPIPLRDRLSSKKRQFMEYLNVEFEYLTEEKAEEKKIFKKVKYSSEKERIRLVSENKKFHKVFVDEDNKEITFYNNAKASLEKLGYKFYYDDNMQGEYVQINW